MRIRCPKCTRRILRNADGRLRAHNRTVFGDGFSESVRCNGSGQMVSPTGCLVDPPAHPGYPDWEEVGCGCHAGIVDNGWGEPMECKTCGGTGHYFRHTKSGALAQYPGGPLIGRECRPPAEPRTSP